MHVLSVIVVVLAVIVGLKAVIGFHFPWEQIVKTQKVLLQELEKNRPQIPLHSYWTMKDAINSIA